MYCKKCGAKLSEGQKFCKQCGSRTAFNEAAPTEKMQETGPVKTQLEEINADAGETSQEAKGDETEYVFLKNCVHREIFKTIITWALRTLCVIIGGMFIFFVYRQFSLDEGYKAAVYVLRGCVFFAPMSIPFGAAVYLKNIFEYKVGDLKENAKPNLLLLANILGFVFWTAAALPFLNASDIDKTGWALLIGFGDIIDLLSCFRWTIIFIILTIAADRFASSLLRKEETEEIL